MVAAGSKAAPTGAPGLHFRLLGPVEASRNGHKLELGARKPRALIALLLLNANRIVPTERLIDGLWGDSPPETARSALQVYVATLRKALGPDGTLLRTEPPGYVLDVGEGALDVERFDTLCAQARAAPDAAHKAALLHEALAMWRDPTLGELQGEPFAAAAVARLEELRLGAIEDRLDADLALGRHRRVVAELETLVAEHPYRERLRAQLMVALYRSGRQSEALDAYQKARRTFLDDLGLEPGHDLRELQARILQQDFRLAPGNGAPPEVAAPERHPVRDRGPSHRLTVAFVLVLALAVVAAAAIAATFLRDDAAPIIAAPNSLAIIDPKTDRVVTSVPVGIRPGPVAVGAGSIWVGNLDDRTLTRIDVRKQQPVANISLGDRTPTGLAVGAGAVWVAHGRLGQLSRVDPEFRRVTWTTEIAARTLKAQQGAVAIGDGSIWAAYGDSTLAQIVPSTRRLRRARVAGAAPAAVAVGGGSVWVANADDATVDRFNGSTFEQGPVQTISVGSRPSALAFDGTVWVANAGDGTVTRIDPRTQATTTIRVGKEPVAVASGAGAVWVANAGDGTISRLDPSSDAVVRTIPVGAVPAGVAVAGGYVWVAAQQRNRRAYR
jgi:YVTN family beta-propeller protein